MTNPFSNDNLLPTHSNFPVSKGGEGSGRYPKGSGAPDIAFGRNNHEKFQDPYTVEGTTYKFDDGSGYPYTLDQNGEVSYETEVGYSYEDGDGWNSPRYASDVTNYTYSFDLRSELPEINEYLKHYSVNVDSDNGLTRTNGVAIFAPAHWGYNLTAIGEDPTAPVTPDTIVYGSRENGTTKALFTVGMLLKYLGDNPDAFVTDKAQEDFDNQPRYRDDGGYYDDDY